MLPDEALWTIEQVATFLNVTALSIRARIARHTIPYVKVGHLVRFRPSEVQGWIAKQVMTPVKEPSSDK